MRERVVDVGLIFMVATKMFVIVQMYLRDEKGERKEEKENIFRLKDAHRQPPKVTAAHHTISNQSRLHHSTGDRSPAVKIQS